MVQFQNLSDIPLQIPYNILIFNHFHMAQKMLIYTRYNVLMQFKGNNGQERGWQKSPELVLCFMDVQAVDERKPSVPSGTGRSLVHEHGKSMLKLSQKEEQQCVF